MGKRVNKNGENFILKLPLQTEIWQEHILNKRFELCRKIYNDFQSKMLKRYKYISQMNEFKKCKTKKEKSDFLKTYLNGIFTEFGFIGEAKTFGKMYKSNGINSTILGYIFSSAWSAWEKKLYGNGNKIAFKKYDEFNYYELRKKNGGFTGVNINKEKSIFEINLNGRGGTKAKTMVIPFKINGKSDYEIYAFSPKNEIRCVGFQREIVRGKYRFYAVFTFEGIKPMKNRRLGCGNVGIDLGPSTIAVSSDSRVIIDELAKDINKIDDKLIILQRKSDRSRRSVNPDNFKEDGTIKRGIKLRWDKSKRGLKIEKEIKELYRKQKVLRKLSHINLANSLLPLGDTFKIENNPVSAWQKKSKETKVNKKGRFQSKKRYGKSIGNHAPSMFVTILENKVKSLGGKLEKIKIANAASQYDFTNSSKTKHELNERSITLSNNKTHLRDTIAAFNIQHFNVENETYDNEQMKQSYLNFVKLEEKEIQRHLTNGGKINKNFGIK